MEFKTIKQLEKEIEELNVMMKEIDYSKQNPEANKQYTILYSKKVLRLDVLVQTKEIAKMVREELEHRKFIEDDEVIPLLEQLLSKLEGGAKNGR